MAAFPTLFSLAGQRALVTGCDRGIGQAMAIGLAEAGADIIGVSRGLPAGGETEAAVRALGRDFRGYRADLGDIAQLRSFIAEAQADFPVIDILLNNAGIIRRAPAAEHSDEDWDAVLSVNLDAPFRLARALGGEMLNRGRGKIIFTASLLTFQGGINVPGYAASKGAIGSLVKALANEWAGRGVHVNAIAPGYVATDNTAALRQDTERSAAILARIPAGRWAEADDFKGPANTVQYVPFNRGRIESLGDRLSEIQRIQSGWAGTALSGPDYVARVGQPVGQMYGYITDGYYTAADFETYNYATRTGVLKKDVPNDASVTGSPVSIGSIKLKDVDGGRDANGFLNVTETDKSVIGNANPKVVGGLNQHFACKGFDASVLLNFVLGNDIYNANKIEFTTSTANTSYANLLSEMANRVRYIDEKGALITDQTTFERVNANASTWSPVRGNYFLHSYAVENGSFLRVNNITFGYSLPKSVISRVKASQLRFYVTMNNLYTFTKYSGYDPEVNTRRGTPLTPGVDYAAYPRSRAFLFGINLGL